MVRVEVTMDGGESWYECIMDHQEKPNKYGKYWCWCFWSLDVDMMTLLASKEIAVRAWDESNNTQPENLNWNLMVCMCVYICLLFFKCSLAVCNFFTRIHIN